ncbi:MAG: hypothetical protein WCX86_01485 [Candidatus Hydrogenedentales bacterium]|jgi:hypothetical protein
MGNVFMRPPNKISLSVCAAYALFLIFAVAFFCAWSPSYLYPLSMFPILFYLLSFYNPLGGGRFASVWICLAAVGLFQPVAIVVIRIYAREMYFIAKDIEAETYAGNLLPVGSPDSIPLLYFHHYILICLSYIFCFFLVKEYIKELRENKRRYGNYDWFGEQKIKERIPKIPLSLSTRMGIILLFLFWAVVCGSLYFFFEINVFSAESIYFVCFLFIFLALSALWEGYIILQLPFTTLFYAIFDLIAAYHQKSILYALTRHINPTNPIPSISSKYLGSDFFKQYVLSHNEPEFYGNIILPWIQSEPERIGYTPLIIITLLVLCCLYFYFLSKKYSHYRAPENEIGSDQ